MEFSKIVDIKEATESLISNNIPIYRNFVSQFFRSCFRQVEDDFIQPYVRSINASEYTDLSRHENFPWLFSGAFTLFPGYLDIQDKYKWIPVFFNWDRVKDKINPGFRIFCSTPEHECCRDQHCPLLRQHEKQTGLLQEDCEILQNNLTKFLNEVRYSISKLIERELPNRSSLSFDLTKLLS